MCARTLTCASVGGRTGTSVLIQHFRVRMLRNHLRLAVDRSHPCQHLRARPQQTLTRRGWTLNLEFLRL